jgi:hypothetical protein
MLVVWGHLPRCKRGCGICDDYFFTLVKNDRNITNKSTNCERDVTWWDPHPPIAIRCCYQNEYKTRLRECRKWYIWPCTAHHLLPLMIRIHCSEWRLRVMWQKCRKAKLIILINRQSHAMINLPSCCCHLKVKTQGFLPMTDEARRGGWGGLGGLCPVRGGNATGLTIVKRSRSSTSRYIYFSPSLMITFARIHDFRTNSRFLYEFLRRFFRISRLSHEFTTFAWFHNSHDQIKSHKPTVSQCGVLSSMRAYYWGDEQNNRLLELIESGDINPNTTDGTALYNYTVTYLCVIWAPSR